MLFAESFRPVTARLPFVGLVAALVLALSLPNFASAAPACGFAGRTVTKTKEARVFKQRSVTYGCYRRTGAVHRLDDPMTSSTRNSLGAPS